MRQIVDIKELGVRVIIKKDIPANESLFTVTQFINRAMQENKYLKDLHEEVDIKMYSFNGLYPFRKIYEKGKVFEFKVKSPDSTFLENLSSAIKDIALLSDSFVARSVSMKDLEYKRIYDIVTFTPAIATIDGKYWTSDSMDISVLKDAIIKNTNHKFRLLSDGKKEEYDFIENLTLLREKPSCFKYKKATLLANNLKITVKQDDKSQQMAYMLMGTGLLEKTALGLGCLTFFSKRSE